MIMIDHEDPADYDVGIPPPRWFPAWKDEGGGAVEASRPEDQAPGDVLGSILYFLEV